MIASKARLIKKNVDHYRATNGVAEFTITALFTLLLASEAGLPFLRYSAYLMPIATVLLGLSSVGVSGIDGKNLKWYFVLVLSLIWPALQSGFEGVYVAFLMAYGVSTACFPVPFRLRFFQNLVVIGFGIQALITISAGNFSLNYLSGSVSDRDFESHVFPFFFGILSGLMFLERKYLHLFLCFAGLLLAAKRMPIAGALLGILLLSLYSLTNRFRGVQALFRSPLLQVGVFVLFACITTSLPEIFHYLSRENIVALSMGEFTSGRSNGQVYAYDRLQMRSFGESLVGDGLGAADNLARRAWDIPGILIHSDYLRFMIDLGWPLTIAYILAYWLLVARGEFGVFVVVFMSVNFMTDNTIIYTFVHALLALISFRCVCSVKANVVRT